jgi:tRNA threonylcarbamoyladenosine biosynthesis protein TsaB
VGVATARALAQSLNIPLVGVSSLELMARATAKKGDAHVVTIIPALAGEVYFAGYDGSFRVRQEPVWKNVAELETYLRKAKGVLTIGVEAWRDDVVSLKRQFPQHQWIAAPVYPHPNVLAKTALEKFQAVPQKFHFEKTVPLYLQPSWAERTQHAPA